MLVGQVLKTFGALYFIYFEIENYVRYETF